MSPDPSLITRMYARQFFGIVPGLETTRALLAKVGNPERELAAIHVAGTNGKGSVCAFIAAGLRATGMAIGLYTSPHLVTLNERFQINGEPIPDDELAALLAEMESVALDVERETGRKATFFECTTAGAFLWFKRKGAKLCVIETGMGGRLDATNVVTPLLTVITRIALDHRDYLGDTLAKIAEEKAGILKAGRPVILAPQSDNDASAVIERIANERNAPLITAAECASVRRVSGTLAEQKVSVSTTSRDYGTLTTPLAAAYQLENIATAVTALETLGDLLGFPLPDSVIATALRDVRWQGRFQLLSDSPPTLLDGAHNPDGAEALVKALKAVRPKIRRIGWVCGHCEDKDVEGFYRLIATFASGTAPVWTVPLPSPRGMAPERVATLAARFGFHAMPRQSVDTAIAEAQAWARENGGVIVICGSLFLVGEVLKFSIPLDPR